MNCPICNFKSDIKIQNAKSYYSTIDFNIRECKECELLFTDTTNREVEIKNIYKNVYDYSVHDCTKNEKLWRIKNTYKKVSNKLNLDSNSNVLDIGCMQGFFLNLGIASSQPCRFHCSSSDGASNLHQRNNPTQIC